MNRRSWTTLRRIYYLFALIVVVAARTVTIFMTTSLLVVLWALYNIVMFDFTLLVSRVPWRIKRALISSYNGTVVKKALELCPVNAVKHLYTSLAREAG